MTINLDRELTNISNKMSQITITDALGETTVIITMKLIEAHKITKNIETTEELEAREVTETTIEIKILLILKK